MVAREQEHLFWALFKPAPDVPGQWIGHLLDLDIVSQGNDLAHAREMLTEAIFDTLKADLLSRRNPLHRQKAPEADWDELFDVLRRGQRLEGTETSSAADGKMVQQFRLRITAEDPVEKPVREPEPLAPLWIQQPEAHVSP